MYENEEQNGYNGNEAEINPGMENEVRTSAGSDNPYTQGQPYGTYGYRDPYNGAGAYGQSAGSRREEPRKKKKEKSSGKKILVAAAAGLFFGVFAGAGFFGMKAVGTWAESQILADSATEKETMNVSVATLSTAADTSVINTGNTVTTVVTDVTQVVEDVMPSIVSITNEYTQQYFYYTEPVTSSGSGIIIGQNDEELLIVTNYHVIEDTEKLTVTFADDKEAEALVKGTDSKMDLAVIAVALKDLDESTMNAIEIARIGDSDSLRVGEPAIAIGNALGYGQSVTTGVISALDRELQVNSVSGTFIQTDAAINPGNSGGALININGEVIGINSSKIGGSTVEGMGYAIPISAAQPIIEELMNRTTRVLVEDGKRGTIGIVGATITSQEAYFYGYPEGVYVTSVYDGTAADRAGIRKGDFIISFDGESIRTMDQLKNLLSYYEAGSTVEVEVQRLSGDSYRTITLEVTLGDQASLDVH